jgi:hypothetical protein
MALVTVGSQRRMRSPRARHVRGPACSRRYSPYAAPMTVLAKMGAHAGRPDPGNEPLRSRSQFRAALLRAAHKRICVRHDVYHTGSGGAPK